MKIDHHKYRVSWSNEDQEYVGLCEEFESLSFLAKTPEKALHGIRQIINCNIPLRVKYIKHFKHAKRIINCWPKWKQAVRLPPLRKTCSRCGNLLHQTGV